MRFQSDVFALDDEIQRLGARHFSGKRLFEKIKVPSLPDTLAIDELPEQIVCSLSCLEAVAEKLREGFWTQLWNVFKKLWDIIRTLLGLGKSEVEILAEYAKAIQPELEDAFRDEQIVHFLEDSVRPVFDEVYRQILDLLANSRTKYREKIQARCDDMQERHRKATEDLRKLAEEDRRIREECIAPLRAEIEVFERTVETATA